MDSTNTNNTRLNPVSSALDSTNMDPVSNTNADPTSSTNQDEYNPPCSLKTISNLNPSNSSMATATSKNPNISTSEDHLSPSEEIELMNALKKLSVKVDAMMLKCQDTSEEAKKKKCY